MICATVKMEEGFLNNPVVILPLEHVTLVCQMLIVLLLRPTATATDYVMIVVAGPTSVKQVAWNLMDHLLRDVSIPIVIHSPEFVSTSVPRTPTVRIVVTLFVKLREVAALSVSLILIVQLPNGEEKRPN